MIDKNVWVRKLMIPSVLQSRRDDTFAKLRERSARKMFFGVLGGYFGGFLMCFCVFGGILVSFFVFFAVKCK